MAWTFANADHTIAIRDGDGATVSWNPALNQPSDVDGYVGRKWKEAGSPIPQAYVAPDPTADQIRAAAWLADADRQNLITQIANATPAQVKAYVNTNVTDLASAKVLLTKIILLVGMTIRS